MDKIKKALTVLFFTIGIILFYSSKDTFAQFQLFPAFGRIVVASQATIMANGFPATLTLIAGSNITLTTDNVAKTLTIASTALTSAITSINTDTTAAQTITRSFVPFVGPSVKIVNNLAGGHDFQFNIADATHDGFLLTADWNSFNNKVSNATHTGDATGATALTLATVNADVGSFSNATVTANAKGLITAISSGTVPITGSGTTDTIPKFTSSSAIGNSLLTVSGNSFTYTGTTASGLVLRTTSGTAQSWNLENVPNAFRIDDATSGLIPLSINLQDILSSATQPRVSAYNSTTQAITTGTHTAVTFDSENWDIGTLHSTSSSTSRITIPTGGDGLYHLTCAIYWDVSGVGQRLARIYKNGAALYPSSYAQANVTYGVTHNITAYYDLVAGDYLEVFVFQDSGGNLNISTATSTNPAQARMQLTKIW